MRPDSFSQAFSSASRGLVVKPPAAAPHNTPHEGTRFASVTHGLAERGRGSRGTRHRGTGADGHGGQNGQRLRKLDPHCGFPLACPAAGSAGHALEIPVRRVRDPVPNRCRAVATDPNGET
nr:hypothetical protein GCM10020092_021710 [Actinoplanes digitatis]